MFILDEFWFRVTSGSTTQVHLKWMHICAIWLWGIFGFWYCKWIYNPLCDFIGPLAIVQITQLAMACVLLLTHSSRAGVAVPFFICVCSIERADWVCVWVRSGTGSGVGVGVGAEATSICGSGHSVGLRARQPMLRSSNDIWGTDVYVKPIIRRWNETWGCEMSDMEVEGAGCVGWVVGSLEWVGWGGWE